MNCPFAHHGIRRLSPTRLNKARHSLALFLVEDVLGHRASPGAAMMTGLAAETGVTLGLADPRMAVDACAEQAVADLEGRLADTDIPADERARRCRDLRGDGRRPGMVAAALAALRPLGRPDDVQGRVELRLDGIAIPVVGYRDFLFADRDVELKTTSRLAAGLTPAQRLQAALYARGSGRPQAVCVATPRQARLAPVTPAEVDQGIAEATAIAHTLRRFLALSADPAELAGLVIPDYESYRWAPATTAAARNLFGY